MKAVVTGGAGFIGSHLVKELVSRGWEVTVVDNFSTGSRSNLDGIDCEIIECDINGFLPIIPHNVLFHLASPVSVEESLKDPEKYYHQIIDGTDNVVRWSKGIGAHTMIMASTAAVYGDSQDLPVGEDRTPRPMSPYASAKHVAETVLKKATERTVIRSVAMRFFNVYGEGQRSTGGYVSVIPVFRNLWEQGSPLTINGDGEQTRDFVYVGDVVDALISATRAKYGFSVYNVGSGEEITVNQIAEAFGGEVIYREAINEPRRSLACVSKIKKELGWNSSTSLEHWIETIR